MSSSRRTQTALSCLCVVGLPAILSACFLYGLPPDPPVVESSLLRQYILERTDRETGRRHVTLRLPLTPNDTLVARFTHLPGPQPAITDVEVNGAPRVVVNDSMPLAYNDGEKMRPAMLLRVLDAQRIVVDIPKPRYDTKRVRLDVVQRAVFRAFVARMTGTARKDLAKVVGH
jgi:hypothetical protein